MCNVRIIRAVIIAGVAISFTGCASFKAHNVPEVKLDMPAVASSNNTAFIDVQYHTQWNNDKPVDHAVASQMFRTYVAEVLRESGVFSSFTFSETRGTNADHRVRIETCNREESEIIFAMISGFTLTVIPCTARNVYELKVQVEDRAGLPLKEYKYKDSVRTWIWLPLFVATPFMWPNSACESTQINMLKAWIRDAIADGVFAPKKASTVQ